jgi:holin-like protein
MIFMILIHFIFHSMEPRMNYMNTLPATFANRLSRVPLSPLLRTVLPVVLQVAMLAGVWLAADHAAAWLHLPFSGGVVGLLLMVVLMLGGALPPDLIERGADWLLSHMLLFFIPLVVSVVQFTGLLHSEGLRLMLAIGLGFLSVLLAVAFTVEWACCIERGRRLQALRALRALRAARAPSTLRAGAGA